MARGFMALDKSILREKTYVNLFLTFVNLSVSVIFFDSVFFVFTGRIL